MAALLCLCVLLVFSAWAYGTTVAWAVLSTEILACLAVGTVFLTRLDNKHAESPTRPLWNHKWGLPFIALAAYLAVQALNASHSYSPIHGGLTPKEHIVWLPRSVDASVTLRSLAKFLAYVAVFWCVRVIFNDRESLRTPFLTILVANGFVMAFLVILQRSGVEQVSHITGMFINPNNYGAYANLLLPATLALGREAQIRAEIHAKKSHPGYLLYFIAVVIMVSVFLSRSRAAMGICVALALSFLTLEFAASAAARRMTALSWLPAFAIVPLSLACIALTCALTVGFETGGRETVYSATALMFFDRRLFGIGSGAFSRAFPYYQPESLWGFYRYAHSDWLQYLAELGLVGIILLAALGAGAVSSAAQPNAPVSLLRSGRKTRGIILALYGLAIHACIDFPLHIPAITFLAAAWIGLLRSPNQRAESRASRAPCAAAILPLRATTAILIFLALCPSTPGDTTNVITSIPYREGFDGHTNGIYRIDEDGWRARFDATNKAGAVSLDMIIQPSQWPDDEQPKVAPETQLALRLTTNGAIAAWCRVFDAGAIREPAWLEFNHAPIKQKEWIRLTISISYAADALYDYFQIQLNEKPLTHHYGFGKPDGSFTHIGTHDGSWFLTATTRSGGPEDFSLSGSGFLDQILVTGDGESARMGTP